MRHMQPMPADHPAPERGPHIMRTMFETDRIPHYWRPWLLAVDEVWVPCQHNVDAFQRAGVPAERLRLLPGTIDFELFDPTTVEPLAMPGARGFTFLTNFDFTERKGWTILLDAWAEAFDPDDDVSLILKCVAMHSSVDEIEARVNEYLAGRKTAPVILNTNVLPIAELPRIYASADAYVLASRGEGWGRPYTEAMAMGLPTIGSRWGGNLAFMDDENSWLVEGEVGPIERWDPLPENMWKGHRWFKPDRDSLIDMMREVFAGGPATEARAAAARGDLLERFGSTVIASRLAELCEDAIESWRERSSRSVTCVWRGEWGAGNSLSIVNDALSDQLERAGETIERLAPESRRSEHEVPGISHHWPPKFLPPSEGPFVLIQPWEFGAVPPGWVGPIRDLVDEVWTPSEASRQTYLRAGVAPELVHVVPNGVDLERFCPDGPVREIPAASGTVFLFVGGATIRKGIDVLLEAWARAFTSSDDVCLVVKSFGWGTVYRGQTHEDGVAAYRDHPEAPNVVLLDEEISYDDLPALYRAADVLVQPYRGEGFCLPALEALASGRPVIATANGPTDDFVSDECGWLIRSRQVPVKPSSLPASLYPGQAGFLLEPDVESLVEAFRQAADPSARAPRAAAAREHAEKLSWTSASEVARARLEELRGRTPIRHVAPASVPNRRKVLFTVLADWERPETWVKPLRAYVEAFAADDDTTLVLSASDEAAATRAIMSEIEASGVDPTTLPDIAVAAAVEDDGVSLQLGVDAVITPNGYQPPRARRVVPSDPSALRALATAP